MRDGAFVDARGDRAGIDAEGFGGFFAGDDEAAPLAEVVHVEGTLPPHHTIRSCQRREMWFIPPQRIALTLSSIALQVSTMETERVRGNPAGITNTHVAQNIRTARQAIGMDLRTMSDRLKAAGRKLSASGISKLEAGDRRVDVDDLTVIAYLLRTTPAALLTPPDEQTTLTGVPEGYEPEEIDRWMHEELVLTNKKLFNY